jgi:hypothetical protein
MLDTFGCAPKPNLNMKLELQFENMKKIEI